MFVCVCVFVCVFVYCYTLFFRFIQLLKCICLSGSE